MWNFIVGFGGRTQYFYAIMLTLISANALILCQVTNFSCLFCGERGSPFYYGARVLSICLGCLAPMLVSNLILPWYDPLAKLYSRASQMHFLDVHGV
jgi:hypothetical protein